MIKFVQGNIFDSKATTLANAVNCVGVMGGGIALEFKYRFPTYYSDYKYKCENNKMEIGKCDI